VPEVVLGRADECGAIDGVLDAARAGLSGALVLQGDAGMGKTTLLEYAVSAAAGLRVLRLAGIESESEFGYAALHRLLSDSLDEADALPARQHDALSAAFGLVAAEPADRFIVGLAALSLLARIAVRQPLLCIIDDAQWLDRESLDTLAFVGRRLHADGIALLFAVRRASTSKEPPLDGLPTLGVEGLPDDAALALLDTVVDHYIDRRVARDLVAATRGCPLAVIEFGAALNPEQFAGGDTISTPLTMSSRLERHFLHGVQALPQTTQTFLLVASADPSGDPARVFGAATLLDVPPDAAAPAISTDLVVVEPRVEFRHPLIRSAVLQGASAPQRQKVHRALALVCERESDRDGRAWHLAAATAGTDESVASELQERADRARARGRYATEAAFYSRAAALTPDASRRAERLLAAAQAHVRAGAHKAANVALTDARPHLADGLLGAHVQRLDAALHSFSLPNEMPALLLETARTLEELDVRMARDTYAEALEAVLVSAQLTKHVTMADVGRAALHAPRVDTEPTLADAMIDAFGTRLSVGYVDAVPMLRRGIALVISDDRAGVGVGRAATLGNNAAADVWDADGYGEMLHRLEPIERERGALDSLRITLGGLAHFEMWRGKFALAEDRHTEATEIAAILGADPQIWDLLKVELFAWQGREAETRETAAALQGALMKAAGAGVSVNLARIALGILDLALGNHADAFDALWPLLGDDVPPHGSQCLAEIVEAAAGCGRMADASIAFRRLDERANASGTKWALGLRERSAAVLARGDDAEKHHRAAISHLEATLVQTDLARAYLLYGEWLLSEERRPEAREQLRLAHGMFEDMGARAFVQRTGRALEQTGAAPRRRADTASDQLTSQEHQVARLAVTGATNNEIAAALFISASTVDYHLRKVYRKLGITSRRQLSAAMPA
jgi:DNA-binding CsgD family transcriptional regulator